MRIRVERTVLEVFNLDAESCDDAEIKICGAQPDRVEIIKTRSRGMMICERCEASSEAVVRHNGMMLGGCCRPKKPNLK